MPLTTGSRLGPYDIVAPIGAGGMGEVYRAMDRNLGRAVAIKVLPDEFAGDAERLARFEREARTLASLNHPNIAIVHGLEGEGATRALVMELVEGPTLADRIADGPLPVDEALDVARQIADALEAAHEQGIVHRDLKPANVKLRPDGTVKVLDFGLAKAMEPAGGTAVGRSLSPTITSPAMTQAGMIIGTAAYMAPEQAKGRGADKRSDIWSFGCLLYEMLTGRRAFEGEDVSDTLAAVLRSEPDWSALPADLPPAVVALIQASMDRDRRRRIGDIAAVLFVLRQPAASRGAASPPGVRRGAPIGAAAGALLAGLALAGGGWWMGSRAPGTVTPAVTRFVVPLGSDERFLTNGRNFVAVSPDGTRLAYVANSRIYLRRLDRLESTPVRGTEGPTNDPGGSVRTPFFSPDGQWIGFWRDGQIRKVHADGGSTLAIAPASVQTMAFAWENDGTILFADEGRISRVSEAGGTPEVLVDRLEGVVQSLQRLPGRRLLLTLFPPGSIAQIDIVVHSLDTGERQTILQGGLQGRYLPTGHLVYFAEGSLLAVPFDLERLRTTGSAVPVVEGVATSGIPGRATNVAHVGISLNGTLAYVAGRFVQEQPRRLVWVDRRGREEAVGAPDRPYIAPRVSPDGRFIALTINDQERDVWMWESAPTALRRFTMWPSDERYSVWTPDSRKLAFGSQRGDEAGAWWHAADGSGEPQRIYAFPFNRYGNLVPTAISPDGSRLLATGTGGRGATGGSDIWLLTLTGQGEPQPLIQTQAGERNAEFSPDGRWIAFESIETGQAEIVVRPFPNVDGGRWQVSSRGGSQPAWARSGKELFFVNVSGELMGVRVDGTSPLSFSTPQRVLENRYVWTVPTYAGRQYDVSPDDRRFLMLSDAGERQREPDTITVVQNWFEELRRRVPTPRE